MVSKGSGPSSRRPIKSAKRPKLSQPIQETTKASKGKVKKTTNTAPTQSSSSSEDESAEEPASCSEEAASDDLKIMINGLHPSPAHESDGSSSHSGSNKPDSFVRHRAQRKFAQGVTIFNLLPPQPQPTTPPLTPHKIKIIKESRSTPIKKVPLPHFSPPVKRPKTEDFINFLCYRGTPALPKSLKFFNYPSPFEQLQQRTKSVLYTERQLKTLASKNALAAKESANGSSSTISSIPRSRAASVCSGSDKSNNNNNNNNHNNNHHKSNNSANIKKKLGSSSSCSSLQALPSSTNVPLSRAGGGNSILPISPIKPTHINEQEAKFALSALKLKYHQNKLSKDKGGGVVINKLIKKVKTRSAILTRSKSKDDGDEEEENEKPTPQPPVKVIKKSSSSSSLGTKESKSDSARELKRSLAPSPDIIDGVSSHKYRLKSPRHGSSSSSSNSSSSSSDEDDGNGDSSDSSRDDESTESSSSENCATTIRTLRSGDKSIILPQQQSASKRKHSPIPKDKDHKTNLNPPPKGSNKKTDSDNITKKKKKKKLPMEHRVSTRSSRRTSASPLRELPMYNEAKKKLKLKKKLNKRKSNQASKNKAKDNDKSMPARSSKSKSQQSDSDKSPVPASISTRRPSRRTKENAALFLGFITHAFSSDDDNDDKHDKNTSKKGNKSDGGNDSSADSCDTSSSETKFLESKYKAIMKRDQERLTQKKVSSSASTSKRANFLKKLRMNTTKVKNHSILKKAKQTLLLSGKSKPEKRLLRSQSSKEDQKTFLSMNSVCRVTRRRSTVPSLPKPKILSRHAGAVRKTTQIVPRKNYHSRITSGSNKMSDSESEEQSSSSSTEGDDEEEENSDSSVAPSQSSEPKVPENVTKTNSSVCSTKSPDEPSTSSGDEDEVEEEKMDLEKVPRIISPDLCAPISRERNSLQLSSSEESEPELGEKEEEDDASTDSDSVIIEKVEIAIQVDMDFEEGIIQQSPPPPLLTPEVVGSTATPYSSGYSSLQRTGATGPGISIPLSVQQHHHINPSIIPHQNLISAGFNGPTTFFPGIHTSSSTVEFISQHRLTHTTHHHHQDFSAAALMIPTPGGIPTSSAFHTNYGSHAAHPIPIPIQCFSTSHSQQQQLTGATTTFETHIRSVAANLDIPLVRPIVTPNSNNTAIHPHQHMQPLVRPTIVLPGGNNSGNFLRHPHHQPLTRPIVTSLWNNCQAQNQAQQQQPHFSAFRSPNDFQYSQQQQQPYSRPPQSNILNTSTASAYPGLSAHGLSLIQSLPNVSIVPKFDRNSKPLVNIPPPEAFPTTITKTQQKSSSCAKAPSKLNNKNSKKEKEPKIPKERGRKRKVPFPPPTSPLTVRKDSINPATYAGTSSKKNSTKSVSSASTGTGSGTMDENSIQSSSPAISTVLTATTTTKEDDSFSKLLQASKNMPSTTANDENPAEPNKTSESKPKNKIKKLPSLPNNSKSPSPPPKKSKSTNSSNSKASSVMSKDSRAGTPSSEPKPKKIGKSKSMENPATYVNKKSDKCATNTETCGGKSKKPERDRPNSPVFKSNKSETQPQHQQRPSSTHSVEESEQYFPHLKIHSIPTYYPSEEEFHDPFKYIAQIQKEAEQFGMAKIVPPKSFRPECNVEDDMRFTAYNHYIHRMHSRWGENVQERVAMLENLRKSKVEVSVSTPPMIGGMEIDLSTLYHTVQLFGGLTEVIQKHKWNKVSDAMHIPKAANDRAVKLDAIYVKYVLPYEILSEVERKRLHTEVNEKWKARLKRDPEDQSESDSEEDENPYEEVEDCILKGKSTPLSAFFRIARNTLSMLFQNKEPTWSEVESRYWKLVKERDKHLCVYSGSIDCTGSGHRSAPGFPTTRGQSTSKHPWNLKVFANSMGSLLRSMGPVMGATVPTLQIGMIFTTYCWYSDPHGLPWIEYLHTGGSKIWYVVPASHAEEFRKVVSELMPRQCRNKKLWLVSDSAMVPPEILLNRGVPLYRIVQEPGEFLVVFPKAFTSSICTGYVISESVSFATTDWLKSASNIFNDIRESKEPPVFPLEQLLISLLTDNKVQPKILKMALSIAERIFKDEFKCRKKLKELGLPMKKVHSGEKKKSSTKKSNNTKTIKQNEEEAAEIHECELCNYNLILSFVIHKPKELVYCLPHAIEVLSKYKGRIKTCVLYYEESETHLRSILEEAKSRLKE